MGLDRLDLLLLHKTDFDDTSVILHLHTCHTNADLDADALLVTMDENHTPTDTTTNSSLISFITGSVLSNQSPKLTTRVITYLSQSPTYSKLIRA
jgi:hypothetical protein